MSALNPNTSLPAWAEISSAAIFTAVLSREQIATRHFSAASCWAQPRPSPRLAAVTRAIFPLIPKSNFAPPWFIKEKHELLLSNLKDYTRLSKNIVIFSRLQDILQNFSLDYLANNVRIEWLQKCVIFHMKFSQWNKRTNVFDADARL
jgi:hypothetical protein